MNEQLTVHAGSASYPVVVAAGALARLDQWLAQYGTGGALWLVSDENVYELHGADLEERLRNAGYRIQAWVVPAGEASKNRNQLARIQDWLLESGVERRDAVLALGGGVIGDLAGFAAATVLRGIAVVQLPTTLLAMVDAAVGGKTGINHPRGKNLLGAFHQPALVLADTDTLATLPPRELRAGWAEVIKHGVIRDARLFADLEQRAAERGWQRGNADAGLWQQHEAELLAELVRRAVAVKVAIVNADEREQGERMFLNYGHTLGHALEAATGYDGLLHGEAVAIGMHLAAQIAVALGQCAEPLVTRQRALLEAFGLSVELPPGVETSHLINLTLRDKKVRNGRVHWVLPTSIGAVTIRDDVPEDLVRGVLLHS